jgi:hypothetical protein
MTPNYSNNTFGAIGSSKAAEPDFDVVENEKERMADGYEDVIKDYQEKWNKEYAGAEIFPQSIAFVHPAVVEYLLSSRLVAIYDKIAKQAGLDAKNRSLLPQIVWNIVVSKKWDELDQMIESKIQMIHSIHINVVSTLNQEIISKVKILSQSPIPKKILPQEPEQKREVSFKFSEALSKYPKLGEQLISTAALKLRVFPTPVRPSIKNWISDYHDYVGSGSHNSVDRGNYLFQSENGKKLTSADRQRVSDILKALDQDDVVIINPESEMIVFKETSAEIQKNPAVAPVQSLTPKNIERPGFFSSSKDNVYVSKVQHGTISTPVINSSQQETPISSQTMKSFSPNFAGGNNFVMNKKDQLKNSFNDSKKTVDDESEIFRNNLAKSEQSQYANFGSDNFNEFSNSKNEGEINGELRFSSPQKFVTEKENETIAEKTKIDQDLQNQNTARLANQAATYRQSWQHIGPSSYAKRGDQESLSEEYRSASRIIDLKNLE